MNATEVIQALNLEPLSIEGGHFREIYRSASRTAAGQSCGTSIYYLLRSGERSCWHRVASDEIWLYHAGSAAVQQIIHPDGRLEEVRIGADLLRGEVPQSLIPAGCWQSAVLADDADPEAWGLFGAVVFPAFEYSDFTAATDAEIRRLFPKLASRFSN